MTDITAVEFIDLLPDSISGDEDMQAMADAIQEELREYHQQIEKVLIVGAIDKQPDDILDHLANRFSVTGYSQEFTTEQKRGLIQSAFSVHRTRGTVGAVKTAMDSLGYNTAIVEWFEYGGTPGTFRIDINAKQESIPGDGIKKLTDLVMATKNERSHLDGVTLRSEIQNNVRVAAAGFTGIAYRVYPESIDLTSQQIDDLELTIYNMGN